MIKHEVDDHASDRYVHPHRQGPARDGAMTQEVSAEGPSQCDDDEGHDHRGHYRVRSEDDKINWARNSLAGKGCGSMMRVIDDVGNQKEQRSSQSQKLTAAMRQDPTAADEIKAGGQKYE